MTAQQLLQAVVQEMGYLRSKVMQPLTAELDSLRQQREALVQEIRQLEGQRQGYALPSQSFNQQQVITEFLQALMARLQDSLSQQVAQTLKSAATQALPYRNETAGTAGSVPSIAATSGYTSMDSLAAQSNSDQLLINLDATLRIVFDALQRDVRAYQESLSQGLDRMHTLGQQGEMMFTALINHLAQQLGREASSYLQISPELPTNPPSVVSEGEAPPRSTVIPPSSSTLHQALTSTGLEFPYPGVELPGAAAPSSLPSPLPDSPSSSSLDAGIEAWLRSTRTQTSASTPESSPSDLADLDLDSLDLTQVDPEDLDSLLDGEVNAASGLTIAPNVTTPAADSADDAPLDITLQHLFDELDPGLGSASSSLTAAPSEPIAPPLPADRASTRLSFAEDTELDEFYESLFGPSTNVAEAELAQPSPDPIELSSALESAEMAIADPTLGWDLFTTAPPADPALFEVSSLSSEMVEEPVSEFPQDGAVLNPDETEDGLLLGTPGDTIATLTDLLADPFEQAAAGAGSINELEMPDLFEGNELTPAGVGETLLITPDAPRSPEVKNTPAPPPQLEDTYIPASPEETLLPLEEPMAEAEVRLLLDEATMTHLSEDLSSLESLDTQGFQPPSDAFEFNAEALTLDDFLADSFSDSTGTASPSSTPDEWSDLSLDALGVSLTEPNGIEPDLAPSNLEERSDRPSELSAAPSPEFSLEGLDDLFVDTQPISTVSVPPPEAPVDLLSDSSSMFVLEGMDDLFTDIPTTASPTPSTSAPTPTDSLATFTLEEMGDFFVETPTVPPTLAESSPTMPPETKDERAVVDSPPVLSPVVPEDLADAASPTSDFSLERMGDLYVEVPSPTKPIASSETVPPLQLNQPDTFTLEQRGGVFIEVPISSPTATTEKKTD